MGFSGRQKIILWPCRKGRHGEWKSGAEPKRLVTTEKMQSVWTLFPLHSLCWKLLFLPSVPWLGRLRGSCTGKSRRSHDRAAVELPPAPSASAFPRHTALGAVRETLNLGRWRGIPMECGCRSQRGSLEMRCCREKGGKTQERDGCSAGGKAGEWYWWRVLNLAKGELCWKPCFIPPWAFLEAVVVLSLTQDAGG